MQGLLSDNIRFTTLLAAKTTGSSDGASSNVDMAADGGFDGVMFVMPVGDCDTAGTVEIHAGQAATDTTITEYTSAAVTTTGVDDTVLVLDIYRPTMRYVGVNYVRGGTTNSTIGPLIAIQYRGKTRPSTSVVGVAGGTIGTQGVGATIGQYVSPA